MDWLSNQIRLFRALLYCYPAEFRHEYGFEMEQLFADRLRTEPRLRLWLETLADIGFSAPKEHWHILLSDLRYGTRVLTKAPAFALVAIAVIGLGIGATTAVFSLVNTVLLRSLPYGKPQELVYAWSPNPRFEGVPQEMAPNVPDFYDWQRLSHSFSSITMLRQAGLNMTQGGSTIRVEAAFVTGNFFSTLEANPEFGRPIDASDDQQGHNRVAVISHRLWTSQFAASQQTLGKQIQLNRDQYTVIGVMPKDFGYPFEGDIPYGHFGFNQTDVWLPLAHTPHQKTNRVNFESSDAAIGRLRNGVSPTAAQKELAAIQSRLDPLYPEMWRGWTVLVRPLVQTIIGPVETMLWLLLGAVFLVLLIAMSNVANLLFSRAIARSHEMGIRSALGAERGRMIRQLLTESLLLSCAGGTLGIGVAYAAVAMLTKLNPGDIPRFDAVTVDLRALLVAVALAIATGLASGLAPAIFTSRATISNLMKSGGGARGIAGSPAKGRSVLILLEVALSVILLAGAGLLIRSYLAVQAVDPGFSANALTFRLTLDSRYNTPQAQRTFYTAFLEKLQNIPGVKRVGASNSTPLSRHEAVAQIEIRNFGRPKEVVENRDVTVNYLEALGTPLLLGRALTPQDGHAVLVNRKFTETYLRGRDPLGQQLRFGIGDMSAAPWSTIVGVVADIRHNRLDEAAQPQVFQPTDGGDHFALQTTIAPHSAIEQARAALHSLDPALSLENIETMSERMNENNARRRFQTTLLTGFSGIAIALALVGLYGLMSDAVKQRTAEIGVRVALGASRGRVVSLVLWHGLRLTTAGLAIGLGGAFALTRLVSGWLFGVTAGDPVTFVVVPLFVLTVSCCACLIPAWSATKIDPIQALRQV